MGGIIPRPRRLAPAWPATPCGPSATLTVRAPSGMPSTADAPVIAYFSMKFGLHEDFPTCSGGLGVLARNFMTSSGGLKLQVVGVGVSWPQGYTIQRIGTDGYPVDEWRDPQPDFLQDTVVRVRVRVAVREVECRV